MRRWGRSLWVRMSEPSARPRSGPVWPTGPTSVRRLPDRWSSCVRSGRPLRVELRVDGMLSTGREFELRSRMFERSEGHDLPFEEPRQGPFGEYTGLAVEGRHPAQMVDAVHEPGRIALQLAPVDVRDTLVQPEGRHRADVLVGVRLQGLLAQGVG